MSMQSVSRFTPFLLHHSSVHLVTEYLTEAARVKMGTVCKNWRDHAVLLALRKKIIPPLNQSVSVQVDSLHPILIFLGQPGGGKGTLAQALVQAAAFRHFSLGDHFKRLVAIGDPLVSEIQEDILHHKPIPIALIYKAVEKELEALGQYGIILDGFPKDPKSIAFSINWSKRNTQIIRSSLFT